MTIANLPLNTDRLSLREFRTSDVDGLFRLYRLPETSRYESWNSLDNEREASEIVQFWIQQQSQDPRKGYTLAIELNESETFIGLIGLDRGFGVETSDRRTGFVGFRLFPVYWNRGYATEALGAVLTWGFESLGLHRVHSGCVAENLASSRVLEKAGMRREGITRKSFPIDDDWYDYHVYSILSEEFALDRRDADR